MKMLALIVAFSTLSLATLRSKADSETYPVTNADKAFFYRVKKAVLADDVHSFSKMISYPLRLRGEKLTLKNEKDLRKHRALIFNSHFKTAIREQSPDALFKDWQGLMIGNGEIWFSEIGEKRGTNYVFEYQIIGINPLKDSSRN